MGGDTGRCATAAGRCAGRAACATAGAGPGGVAGPARSLACRSCCPRWVDAGIFDRPVTPVAAAAIRTALAQAAKSGRAATRRSGARATDLHRLRLRLKRLRYTAELFAGALPRRRANRALATIVAQCATAQASLGELNDDAVAAAEIRAILPQLERHGAGPAVGGPVAVGAGNIGAARPEAARCRAPFRAPLAATAEAPRGRSGGAVSA